jgi:predicted nucleic acid-binding protein
VDSNVFIDAATPNSTWGAWARATLERLANETILVVNPLIYAELSVAYDSVEAIEDALPRELFQRDDLPYEAAFLAGKAFLAYRRRGGTRRSPLPDFYIGAHAVVSGYRLLTRDDTRYRTYFPTLEVIAPPA